MIEYISLPLVCFGFCLIVIEGSIFQGFRDWLASLEIKFKNGFLKWVSLKANQLFNCYMCLGFQFGWVIGVFNGPFNNLNILYNGCFFAATTWIIHAFVQYLGNGNDPNRSIILQLPDTLKIKKIDPLTEKSINNDN